MTRADPPGGLASRRSFLTGAAATLALGAARLVRPAPAATVAVAKCDTYGAELLATLDRMFDQLGGLGRLAKGRTVAIKLNLTGPATLRLGDTPVGLAQWVHPDVVGAVVHLMDRAGARRIRLLEGAYGTTAPLEESMRHADWDPKAIAAAGGHVELENTNALGRAPEYRRFDVPGGGLLFPSYLLHPSYGECDTFVSLAKLKSHSTAGITATMKNCFGNVPTEVYGDPGGWPKGGGRVGVFHQGTRQPSSLAAPERDPASPRRSGYRIPRVIVDVCAARPVHLGIVDGISTMSGSEGPWGGGAPCHPGVLIAGTNCVNTDAVAAAVMGYDPMAAAGRSPFLDCDSFLELADSQGLGSRDLRRIEVAGTPVTKARFDFEPLRRRRARETS